MPEQPNSGCGFAVATLDTTLPLLHEDPLVNPGAVLPVLYRSNVHCADLPPVKRGDLLDGLAGVLTYQFDRYQLILDETAHIEIVPGPMPEPLTAEPLRPGQMMVTTLNLHDYFATEPALAIRRDKIAQLLATYLRCPAIIAVQEVDSATSLRELGAALSEHCATAYAIAHRDSPDARGLTWVCLPTLPGLR